MSAGITTAARGEPNGTCRNGSPNSGSAESCPLSFAQQRLWFLDQLEPDSPLYNIPVVARVRGALDPRALERALNAVMQRHEALRTRFSHQDDQPVQLIDPHAAVHLAIMDFTGVPEPERPARARTVVQEEINRPFNLSSDRLIRARLIRLGTEEHLFVLTVHHIVADEWSIKVFFRDLAAFYRAFTVGTPVELAELPIQYPDFALWQREWLSGPALCNLASYWKEQLAGNPPVLELPTDHPRRAVPTFRGAQARRDLPPELGTQVNALAEREGTTVFMVLLAAFQTLLYHYTQQQDLVIGSPIAGRTRLETEELIGFFVNTLPLRTSLAGDPTFQELLGRTRQTALAAYAHQQLPFDKLVEEVEPARSLDHMPFTRMMFVLQNDVLERLEMGPLELEFVDAATDTAKFDLTLVVQQRKRGLTALLEYNTALFQPETIERFLSHFENIVRGAVTSPQLRLSQLPLLMEAERRQLLFEWNQTDASYPRTKCVHELFQVCAGRSPESIAVEFGEESLSYAALNARANQLAWYLRRMQIGPDTPVAICMQRSTEMIVALLGVLKAGGAYVPLDPSYPKERLAFMLQDSSAPVLLTQQAFLEHLPVDRAKLLCLDADWELIGHESKENPPNITQPENLAYIMYTSGSTGQPKGVAVPHRAINRLVLNTNYILLDSTDNVAHVSNVSFDAATFEIWGALLNGAHLIGIRREVMLCPKTFAIELRDRKITAMFLTTAVFNQMAREDPKAFRHLRTLIVGGEALEPRWVRQVLSQGAPERFLNGYGPTENTTFTCCGLVQQVQDGATSIPIGRPIANTQVFILDPNLNPVPIGVPGELYTGGDGLARGYWNRPELTAQRFIAAPLSGTPVRLYKTGDLARYRPDGQIDYIGRIDQQVKLRGFRIELGEIETVFAQCSAVRECLVVLRGQQTGDKRLIAYFVPREQPGPKPGELRAFLESKLPDYMVPAAFVALDEFPLTPNGKIDHQLLPEPDSGRPELAKQYVAPRDEAERRLASIWERVLDIRPVGVKDKFFELGGHSMLAVRLIAEIERVFGKQLRLATVFQAPTIEKLAAVVREELKEGTIIGRSSIVEIQGRGMRSPLFLVHGAGGGMFWGYVNLARHLGSDQPVYAFRCGGLDEGPEFETLEQMAAHYVKDLRAMMPQGPYYLGGYCFGGNVAFEMGRQLIAQGQDVAFLGLFNCAPPNSSYTRIPWTPRWAFRLMRNLVYWSGYFCQWTRPQRREFFRWKWSLLRKRLARPGRNSPCENAAVEAGDLVDLSGYTQEQRRVWSAHIRALMGFKPQPFARNVHLFRSPGHPLWCSFAPDYGWGELAHGGVNVTIVPGAHEKILQEPCVATLAQDLARTLAKAQNRITGFLVTNGPDKSDEGTAFQAHLADDSLAIGPQIEFPCDTTFAEHFQTQAERMASAIAIHGKAGQLTYAELNARANRLAHYLQRRGVGPEVVVGVCLERSVDSMVALLAILKAGGAYLPLDTDYPTERLNYMLEDSRARLVLTNSHWRYALPAAKELICVDDQQFNSELAACPPANLPPSAGPDNLAYVIYTSGSTGAPKGVEITHRALLNHNFAILEAYQLQPADRVLQFTPLSFDISVEEIFPTWLCGAMVVLREEAVISAAGRFLELVATHQITVLNLPTAYWHELVDFLVTAGGQLPECVRLVIIGGEKASAEAYRRWTRHVGEKLTLINGYGATEATITSTLHIGRGEQDGLPIGRPIANTQVAILDENLQPVPVGATGELHIGGSGLARGYLRRPDLTARSFIRNPFPQFASEMLYRTGDLARLGPDGVLEYVGRLDEQVKIRGYRIELGEIEAALRKHPQIKDAVVMAREDGRGRKRLVAYYLARHTALLKQGELVRFIKQKLPTYMVPVAFVGVPVFPLTPAGKVDRCALPEPQRNRPDLDEAFVPPGTSLEQSLALLWGEMLEFSPIGTSDNFLELGGDSLVGLRLISRIREQFNVELSLADLFSHPNISAIAALLAQRSPGLAASANNPGSACETITMSPSQRRIWLLDQFYPYESAYNRPIALKLRGTLDVGALEQSLTRVNEWQEILRASVQDEVGNPALLILIGQPRPISLPVIDLIHLPPEQREGKALAFAADEARRPCSSTHQVMRPLLVRLGESEHWLLLLLHELAIDSRSVTVLLEHLPRLYAAAVARQEYPLPRLAATYREAVAFSTDQSSSVAALDYWKRQLGDAPNLLELPADYARPPQGSIAGARCPLEVPPEMAKPFLDFAKRYGCSAFPAFLAMFASLLHRYSGAVDLVIGTTLPNSARERWPDLIGNFENRVALRCNLSGDPSVVELLQRISQLTEASITHGGTSFASLLEEMNPQRNPSHTPLFQVFFSFEEASSPPKEAAGLSFEPFEFDNGTSKYDLTIKLRSQGDGLRGWIEYKTALFKPDRIVRIREHFLNLLKNAVEKPTERLSHVRFLTASEEQQLLESTNTRADYPQNKTLGTLFLEQASRTPNAEALVCGLTRVTYVALEARAREIAGFLGTLSIGRGDLVGICLSRSSEMVAAMLGTLMAGAAYVPLDPAYPAERLGFIMADAELKAVLTEEKTHGVLSAASTGLVNVATIKAQTPLDDSSPSPSKAAGPHDLAYVIYTSGSTGKPKGVAIEHQSAVALVSWASTFFSPEELSGVLAATSICFDLSVFELFVPLLNGGKVIIADNALTLPNLAAAQEVKLVNTVPSAIRELLRLKGIPASVQVVNLAGEPLSTELADQIYQQTHVRKVYDLYGPTESTTYSTCALRLPRQPATIGRPLANEYVLILDANLQLLPIGVAGELFIGGEGLARGYLNRPDLTSERFIPNPFKPGSRIYRTGDLARWQPNGNLEYLGRLDHQVKIRGFRIELGEIESVLKAYPGIRDTVVIAREDQPGDKRLVAYLVFDTSPQADTLGLLRGFLRTKLPEHMVPSAFLFLEALPLGPTGKIDRRRLPPPGQMPGIKTAEFVAPAEGLETELAGIWQEVIRVETISRNDNFFDLSGDSLLAMRVIARIRESLLVEVPVSALFTAPTIAALAGVVASARRSHVPTPMPVAAVVREQPLPASFVQERLWFLDQLEPGGHAYHVAMALRIKGRLDRRALQHALDAVIRRHEALRTTLHYAQGQLLQVIASSLRCQIAVHDLAAVPEDAREAAVRDEIKHEAQRPFELALGPLLRGSLVRLSDSDHTFLIVMHHAITDGWSMANFFRELAEVYQEYKRTDKVPVLPPLPLQYVDYAQWQRDWMRGETLENEIRFWKERLEDAPPQIELPFDRSEPENPTGKAARSTCTIPERLLKELTLLGQAEGCTPFMLLMSALAIVLHKWSRQRDLVIGTVVAGRTRREFENLIGCFMNFVPVRARLSGAETGRDVLALVRNAVLEAQAHQDCPFEQIVKAVNPHRQSTRNPLYNVGLLLQNFPADLFAVPHLRVDPVPIELEAALLDLRFEAEPGPAGLQLHCEYKTDLFERDTIEHVLKGFVDMLNRLVGDPAALLTEFHLTGELIEQAATAQKRKLRPKLAIAATFTAEPIADSLSHWLNALEINAEVEFAPYNQVFQELLDPAGLLGTNENGLNVVLLRLEDWRRQSEAGQNAARDDLSSMQRNLKDFVDALTTAAERCSSPFLVAVCPASPRCLAQPAIAEAISEMETTLAQALEDQAGVYFLSPAELAAWYPVADYYDASGEALAHVPYTPIFFTSLGTAIARKFQALRRSPCKVIVLDCDHTLWAGVCGEDGTAGIKLDAPYLALQQFMRAQRDAGRLLCLCSKNNEEDVWSVFGQRLEMPLRREHFAAARLNWSPKSQNLKALSRELQLGLDSFAFIDDNPLECAEVEANCPEVLVLQLPPDPSRIPDFLKHCWALDQLKVTSEDRQRAGYYQQNQQREQLRVTAATLADFLAGLDLKVAFEPLSRAQVQRAAQLTQRTNQFNLTGQRFSENQLSQHLTDCDVLGVKVSDRFGDYGLVGLALSRTMPTALDVKLFLLSCRVLGRGVEHHMLARLGELARGRGLEFVDVHFVPTARNKPALDFLENIGSAFKQPLNGGYVYRFPTAYAADVAFVPPDISPAQELAPKKEELVSASATAVRQKFARCREIALEAQDAATIHAKLQTKSSRQSIVSTGYAMPRSELEQQLCVVLQGLLGLEKVGVRDDFFDLGGHSLLAVRLFAEIERLTGKRLPLVTIFQAPTVEALALLLSQEQPRAADALLVPIHPAGECPPLFLVHGAGGDVLWGYANLAEHLPSDQPIYGIRSRAQAGLEEFSTIEEMAAEYLRAVRAFQPNGPYYLGGYCFGGNVAYEMARQLEAQGAEVGLVALLDSAPSNAGYERVTWWQPSFSWRFVRNFSHWWADFLGLDPQERRSFILRKTGALTRKLKRAIWKETGSAGVDLEEVIDPSRLPENELKLWRIHLHALIQHADKKYGGRVALLRTRGQPMFCSFAEDFCWSKLVGGRLEVRLIPGSHENIFVEPNVRSLAETLAGVLAQARVAAAPSRDTGGTPRVQKPDGRTDLRHESA